MKLEGQVRPGRRSRVIDARGRTFALCDVVSLPADGSVRLRKLVKKAHEHRWLVQVRYVAIGLGIMFGVFGVMHLMFGWSLRGGALLGLVGGIVGGFIGAQERAGAAGKEAVAACLNAEICPACGYSLRGLEGEERVCPECGGVWKVGRAAAELSRA